MRIIDADDIVYESIDSSDTTRYEYYYGTGILAVRKEDIDEMPTIELPERKNGKWDEVQFKTIPYNRISKAKKCSVCGKRKDKYVTWNFCPNCGADMRGGKNEHID